jgi:chemotaxis response regulator CheB/chemotaxis methyl-accepting protein methylase
LKAQEETREFILSVVTEVSKIVSQLAGIQLGQRQAPMVENRLRSRMVRIGVASFAGYLKYLKAHQESETQALLSLLTTHHTYFFREFSHFEFLLNKGLPRLVERAIARGDKKIRVWSAACSRGQEVYSLAMFLNFHVKQMAPGVSFEFWGTVVDPESVKHAKNGVFKAEELKQSPAMYIQDNWIRGTGNVRDFSKVKPALKVNCHFTTANLLKPDPFLSGRTFDLIFCRNVFIYFSPEQIAFASQQMLNHLDPEGLLVLGVSESLNGLKLAAEGIGPSIYQHPQVQNKTAKIATKPAVHIAPPVAIEHKGPIEVLCVDDSRAIHALLGKILTKDQGFAIKARANNGLEALELIKTQKFDVITLDLHMPELDGLGFLTESKELNRPPVMILSAINRDDPSIAQKALALGAADYVEKPSLENIEQAGNEIRSKLKLSLAMAGQKKTLAPKVSVGSTLKSKVLIVDDSATIRNLLNKIISQDPKLEVVAMAELPSQVEDLIKQHKPDVITLDINMPEMDGVTLLRKIYPKYKIPTVMISSISREEGHQVLDALEIGAIDYIQKPQMSDLAEVGQQIRDRIRVAALANNIKVSKPVRKVSAGGGLNKNSLILIGSSTGGTQAVKEVLETLPSQIPPILIVQHIPPIFSAAFAKRLNDLFPFEVKEATHGEEILPNKVLIAPGGTQMGVRALKDKLIVTITDDPPMNRHKPSVDYLFKSVASAGLRKVVAAVLTGMGADGAKQLKVLRDQGARTIAQSAATCVVFGMPKEAIQMGGAEFTVDLEDIGQKFVELTNSFEAKPGIKKAG